MARLRHSKNKTLPPNLYLGVNGHHKYRRPDTGKWHSLGKDKAKATSAAKQLNSMLMVGRDLVEAVMGGTIMFYDFLTKFHTHYLPERKLAEDTTIRDYTNKYNYLKKHFENKPIDEISVLDVAELLDKFPPTASNRYRSYLMLVFKYAVAKGHRLDNPAEKTLTKKIKKQRLRLSLEQFKAIYEVAESWLKNAMDLALQTLQRREEIAVIQFSDIRDDHLYVVQKKTEKHGEAAYIRAKIEEPLQKVIERCRDNIASPYLVHRIPSRLKSKEHRGKNKTHYTQVTPDYITKAFAEARDSLDIFKNMPKNKRPTFHEIRSLGIKLYEDLGADAQNLAGHTTREMTENYKKGHETQWTDAVAGLDVK